MDAITTFFTSLDDLVVAIWDFAEGWRGVLVTLGSIALVVVFCFAALKLRDSSGWLSAIFGMMAATIGLYWIFGVLPSAWVYFVDSEQAVLAGRIIPESLPLMGNFYQVFRDSVVMIETGIGLAGLVVAALWIQKRYPRGLAEGEEARPQAGGYK